VARLPELPARRVLAALERAGFREARRGGSHASAFTTTVVRSCSPCTSASGSDPSCSPRFWKTPASLTTTSDDYC